MIVRVIDVFVKAANIEDFKQASVVNRRGSIAEPGVLRFDVLQDEAKPDHFVLYEVYRDEQATQNHKQTEHYKLWKSSVEAMMAEPRKGTACTPVVPVAESEW